MKKKIILYYEPNIQSIIRKNFFIHLWKESFFGFSEANIPPRATDRANEPNYQWPKIIERSMMLTKYRDTSTAEDKSANRL